MDYSVKEFFITKDQLSDERLVRKIITRSIRLMKESYEYKNFLKYMGGIDIIGFPITLSVDIKIIMEKSLSEGKPVSTLYLANQLMLAIMKYDIPFLIIKTSTENDFIFHALALENLDSSHGIPATIKYIIQDNLIGNKESITKYLEENREFINQEELKGSYTFQLWKLYLKNN